MAVEKKKGRKEEKVQKYIQVSIHETSQYCGQ